jgi:hypothetical protein
MVSLHCLARHQSTRALPGDVEWGAAHLVEEAMFDVVRYVAYVWCVCTLGRALILPLWWPKDPPALERLGTVIHGRLVELFRELDSLSVPPLSKDIGEQPHPAPTGDE